MGVDHFDYAVASSAPAGVPSPIAGAGLPGLIFAGGACSAGGDGGRRSSEFYPVMPSRIPSKIE